jgi:hypothetical protein
VAAAGAVAVNVAIGVEPPARAHAANGPVSISDELGLTSRSESVEAPADLAPLEDLVASRSSREAAATSAAHAQAAADRAEVVREKAAAKATAEAEAKEKEKAEETAAAVAPVEKRADDAPAQAAEEPATEEAASPGSTAVSGVAQISNSAGPVTSQVQAAADVVVSNVPGAAGLTLGGTRASATDPGGHPSGKALDYMVLSDTALGDAIAQYHIAHWDELGVEYIIWQQRMLSSPGGSWAPMEDRGSPTANHYDHVHVNYR